MGTKAGRRNEIRDSIETEHFLRAQHGDADAAQCGAHDDAETGRALKQGIGRGVLRRRHERGDRRGERRPEDRGGDGMHGDQHIQVGHGERVRRHPAGDQSQHDGPHDVGHDQQHFLGEPVDGHADQRCQQDGGNGLQQPDDAGFERRTGDGVDKPQQGQLGDAVAHLRHHLPPPHQREIAAEHPVASPACRWSVGPSDRDGSSLTCQWVLPYSC